MVNYRKNSELGFIEHVAAINIERYKWQRRLAFYGNSLLQAHIPRRTEDAISCFARS